MSRVEMEALRSAALNRWHWFLQKFDDLDNLRQRLDYQTYILAAAAWVASLLLGFADLSTKASIERRLAEDMKATLEQVLPPTLYDNDLLNSTQAVTDETLGRSPVQVYIARRGNEVTGVAYRWNALGGYSGPISLMMGVDKQGTVLGVRVIAHAETPGLGDKIETTKSKWILAFTGRSLDNTSTERWKVKKDAGDFDQFAGATITPRAVVHGLEAGLQFFRRHQSEWLAP